MDGETVVGTDGMNGKELSVFMLISSSIIVWVVALNESLSVALVSSTISSSFCSATCSFSMLESTCQSILTFGSLGTPGKSNVHLISVDRILLRIRTGFDVGNGDGATSISLSSTLPVAIELPIETRQKTNPTTGMVVVAFILFIIVVVVVVRLAFLSFIFSRFLPPLLLRLAGWFFSFLLLCPVLLCCCPFYRCRFPLCAFVRYCTRSCRCCCCTCTCRCVCVCQPLVSGLQIVRTDFRCCVLEGTNRIFYFYRHVCFQY